MDDDGEPIVVLKDILLPPSGYGTPVEMLGRRPRSAPLGTPELAGVTQNLL